jgi:uncharacterized protein YkwD
MNFSRSIATLTGLSVTALAITGAVIVPQVVNVRPAAAQTAPVATATLERDAFNRINVYRQAKGLPVLVWNEAIAAQARIHSQNMANGRVAFGHDGFAARIAATKITYGGAAENVAYNQGYADPAKQAAEGWFKSPGHETNIRGNYSLSAVGVARNAQGKVYFTQLFIRPR